MTRWRTKLSRTRRAKSGSLGSSEAMGARMLARGSAPDDALPRPFVRPAARAFARLAARGHGVTRAAREGRRRAWRARARAHRSQQPVPGDPLLAGGARRG